MSRVAAKTLPKGWIEKRLGDVCKTITKGTTPTSLGFSFEENGINFLKIENIKNDSIDESSINKFINSDTHLALKRSQLVEGDILFSIAGTIGSVAKVNSNVTPANTNQALAIIRGYEDLLKFEYLYFFLKHISENVAKQHARGGALKNISLTDIKNTEIKYPPIEEQKRIVAKIDTLFAKIDKAISLTEESLKQVKNLLSSVLKEVFEKEEIKIGDVSLSTVVDILSGVSLPKLFKGVTERDGDIPFYKVAQMNNDAYIMKGALLKFSAKEAEQHKIKLFPKGTVLLPKRGGAILTNKKRVLTEVASYDSNTMGLKAKNNFISDDYLFTVLRNIDLSDYIDESTIPQINNKHIDRMRIVLTDIKRQTEIVAISDAVGKFSNQTQFKLEEQLRYLKQLKSSILSKAFKGEL